MARRLRQADAARREFERMAVDADGARAAAERERDALAHRLGEYSSRLLQCHRPSMIATHEAVVPASSAVLIFSKKRRTTAAVVVTLSSLFSCPDYNAISPLPTTIAMTCIHFAMARRARGCRRRGAARDRARRRRGVAADRAAARARRADDAAQAQAQRRRDARRVAQRGPRAARAHRADAQGGLTRRH